MYSIQTQQQTGTGEVDMGDKTAEAAKNMQKGAARKVKARLTKRGQNTMRQFCKQAQNMVDEIEIGKKSFPDGGVRSAMRDLVGSLETNLEAVKVVAEAVGDSDIVEIIDEAIEDLSGVGSGDDMGSSEENDDVDVSGLSESEDESPVDIGSIDETPMG
jgi:hypothetical protein